MQSPIYKKGSENVLQYPTNVSPENTAKPADTTKMSFTFNGDRLSYYAIRATDLETNNNFSLEYKGEDMEERNGLPKYNGEEVAMQNNASGLTNGHDYVWQVLLAQRDLAGENPLYDIPVCRGAIKSAGSGSPTVLLVDPNLSIYAWGYNGNDGFYYPTLGENNVVYAGMVIEINGERKFITKYKTETVVGTDTKLGHLEIESAFTNTPSVGDRYQIYANYLISPQYYFMSRATPSLSLTLDYNRNSSQGIEEGQFGLRVTGTYSQAQSSPIKYYTATLYCYIGNIDDPSATLYEIEKSDKQFSQRIDYVFEECFVGKNPVTGEDIDNINYRVIIELVTQDNVTYAGYTSMRIEGLDDYAPSSHSYTWKLLNAFACAVCPDYLSEGSIPQIYRTDLDTGETVHLYADEAMIDYKVSTRANYEYTVYLYDKISGQPYLRSIEHDTIKTNFDGYFITALIPKGDNNYTVGDTWKFICEIDNTTVVQNLDVVSQVGYAPYPSVSSTELNYMSGTLSGYIGNFNCCEHEYKDDIAVVEAWRKFIAQPHPFLLKSQKGDVWVVNIIESPKVEYQEDYYKIPTKFTFSWAECADVNDVRIVATDYGYEIEKCTAGALSDEDWYDVTTDNDYIYYRNTEGIVIIQYTGNSRQPRVPDYIAGSPVVKLAATAFFGKDIVGIWLPSTLKTIE